MLFLIESSQLMDSNLGMVMHSLNRYRPNVAAVILSEKYPDICEFFIAQRCDIRDAWQFPQGGIDSNETPINALYRELKEEIGTSDIEVISEYPKWVYYNFPRNVGVKLYPFKGQKQKYFLVKIKDEKNIHLDTKEPEFNQYKFVKYDDVLSNTVFFKRLIYKRVLTYFKKEGYI